MDLVSSFIMLITSRMAARPSVYKFPVGRKRIETLGIILFCALMTTVAVQLLVSPSPHETWRGSADDPSRLSLAGTWAAGQDTRRNSRSSRWCLWALLVSP